MFLWSLINKYDEELAKKVFLVQSEFMYSDLACVFRKHENSIDNFKHYLENCEYFMTHDISSRKIHKWNMSVSLEKLTNKWNLLRFGLAQWIIKKHLLTMNNNDSQPTMGWEGLTTFENNSPAALLKQN